MSEVKFKVGDLVYCPEVSHKILKIDTIEYDCIYFEVGEFGLKIFTNDDSLIWENWIFHATQENYELLSKLHPNVAFEPPPKHKEPKEIIKAMLESGKWFLVNYRGYGKLGNPPKNKSVTKEQFKKMDMNNYFNKNAFVNVEVFCPNTGKIIIDFVDGEVVLESENEQ